MYSLHKLIRHALLWGPSLYGLEYARRIYWDDDPMLIFLFITSCTNLHLMWLCEKKSALRSAYGALQAILVNGWARVLGYLICLTMAAWFVVYSLDKVTIAACDSTKDAFKTRLEGNIIRVTENRNNFESAMLEVSEKKKKVLCFHNNVELFRYQKEDVEMSCRVFISVSAGTETVEDKIVWKLNGTPVKMSDRHTHKITFHDVTPKYTEQDLQILHYLDAFTRMQKQLKRLKASNKVSVRIENSLKNFSDIKKIILSIESRRRRIDRERKRIDMDYKVLWKKMDQTTTIYTEHNIKILQYLDAFTRLQKRLKRLKTSSKSLVSIKMCLKSCRDINFMLSLKSRERRIYREMKRIVREVTVLREKMNQTTNISLSNDGTANYTKQDQTIFQYLDALARLQKRLKRLKTSRKALVRIESSINTFLLSIARRQRRLNRETKRIARTSKILMEKMDKMKNITLSNDGLLRYLGLRKYQINSTLIVRLLNSSEFGEYACYELRNQSNFIAETLKRSEHLKQVHSEAQQSETSESSQVPHTSHEDVAFTTFLVTEIKQHREVVYAPPGAILLYKTNYWHLSSTDDVGQDYLVNGDSYSQLCPGLFNGCSRILLLYWMLYHSFSDFGIPPFQLWRNWKEAKLSMKEYHFAQCLCENSYGIHQVVYTRNYYNRSSNKYDTIDIVHPHKLVVIPRTQEMLNVFASSTDPRPDFKMPDCSAKPTCTDSLTEQLDFLKHFASLIWSSFNWRELFVLFTILMLWFIILHVVLKALVTFAICVKGIFLKNTNNFGCLFTCLSYGVYVSYSDEDRDKVEEVIKFLENLGILVYCRDRDTPPNVQEISAWEDGIEKSEKFILFISSHYFDDGHQEFETNVIFESLNSRFPNSRRVLIIMLDRCQIPSRMRTFPVEDWTVLSNNDMFLNLKKWAAPHLCSGFEYYISGKPTKLLYALLCVVGLVYCFAALRLPREVLQKVCNSIYAFF